MTDPITKARREWCETPRYPDTRMANICPPEVVAALLDVLEEEAANDYCSHCGAPASSHRPNCAISAAEAAITRALEGKP